VRSHAVLPFLILAGCGASSTSAPSPAAPEPGLAPRPFTAEQIRDAMPEGTEMRYRLEEPGQPPVVLVMRVTAADEKTGTIASEVLAEDGTVVKPAETKTSEWTALVKHASFPAAATTVGESTVETPAGSFPSIDYVVRSTSEDGAAVVTTYRFARALPGPPVSLVREKGGVVVSRMVLLSRR
jgi:hypothetical protein